MNEKTKNQTLNQRVPQPRFRIVWNKKPARQSFTQPPTRARAWCVRRPSVAGAAPRRVAPAPARGRLLTNGAGTSAVQGRVARRNAPAPAPAPALAPPIALSVATTTTPFPTVQPQAGRVSSATTSVLPGDSTARHAAGLANTSVTSEVLELLRQEGCTVAVEVLESV